MTVFALQWTQATDAYVRPAESALTHLAVTSPTNTETVAAVAQASTYAPWSGMRRCNLWDDGTVTTYYGDRCYTDTDVANMGQAMVRMPKFWYTTNHGGGVYIWYISDTGADALPAGADHAWAVHPAFTHNGITKDYIYLGAYEAYFNAVDNKLESKAGVAPTANKTLAQFRTAAQLRAGVANKWEQQDYLVSSAVQLLYSIEYGSFRSQTVLGGGIAAGAAITTGATMGNGNTSAGDVANYLHAMSYRGIENFYGNLSTFMDGINIKADYMVWVADHDFAVDTFAHPYTDTTLSFMNAAGFVSDIAVSATYDYGFIPSAGAGAAGTYYGDYQVVGTSNRVALIGEYYAAGNFAGMFAGRMVTSATTNAGYGARLMYIG